MISGKMQKMEVCPVCLKAMRFYNNGTYYLEDHSLIDTEFYFCKACGTFARGIGGNHVESHLKAASYTDLKNQDKFDQQRAGYFEYLFRLIEKHTGITPSSWLDFGSSYGHFVQYLNGMGIKSQGVELNRELVAYCNANGRETFQKLEDIPHGKKYVVVSLIDSLYYPDSPRLVLQQINRYLKSSGYLIVRITNRNWLAHLRTKILRKDLGNSLGAVTTGFSKNSIMQLLTEEGYDLIKITSVERGKSLPVITQAFYFLTESLYRLTFGVVNICPGIIVIAKKK